jgi:hypothetical protein
LPIWARKWQKDHVIHATTGTAKECLTFGALIDKNWHSPVAKAA